MYLDYFGFDEPPFSITPDPKFVFLSEKHQESLAHLIYGITRGGGAGFVQLTGEVGTGKTTISRLLLEQIPEKTNVALILNPTISPAELLEAICKELKIPLRGIKGKLNQMVDKLNQYLLEAWSRGETTVVIIDEAQNLARDTLEQLRLLTNLETESHKLLQIVLIGQPELRSTMRRNDLRQLAQRVTARYHLMPLSAEETAKYIQHRVETAGCSSLLFAKGVSNSIHRLTQGVPRLINTVADRALLAAYSDDQKKVSKKHVKLAAQEVLPENFLQSEKKHLKITLPIVLITLFILALLGYFLLTQKNVANPKEISQINEKSMDSTTNSKDLEQNIESFAVPDAYDSWRSFFQLWNTGSQKRWHKAECPPAIEIGMACLRRQGNLKQIELLNHPVLLQLENQSLALLTAMRKDQVQILNANQQRQWLPKSWLQSNWYGTYFILWSMPASLLSEPTEKEIQDWVLEMANSIDPQPVNRAKLETWLIDFQSKNGLLADGIIGPETQMALSLSAYNGPALKN